jgi:hypothetical protein
MSTLFPKKGVGHTPLTLTLAGRATEHREIEKSVHDNTYFKRRFIHGHNLKL